MTRSLEITVMAALTVQLLGATSWAAPVPRQYATIEERTVAEAIQMSPQDYLGAVVEVVSRCEVRRGETCLDRVRIIDLIAQAPEPANQRVVGGDFFLFSGKVEWPEGQTPAARYLVFVVPMAASEKPVAYGARLLNVSVDAEDVERLRKAIDAVLHE